MKSSPSPRPSSNSPAYLLGLVVGSIAFVFGAVAAVLLMAVGGREMVVTGVTVGVVVFAVAFVALLRLRG